MPLVNKGAEGGNAPTMINTDGQEVVASSMGFLDNLAFIGPFGQQISDEMISSISVNFADGLLDENFDVKPPALTGDGSATATGGFGQVSSTTGTAVIESRDSVRYSNGRGLFTTFTASFEGGGVGWAGGMDGSSLHDGFPLRYDGSTDALEFGYLREGVFTSPVVVDHVSLGLDLTKVNIWVVLTGFLGVANPTLLVKMDTWKVAGVIKTEGRLDSTHVRLPAFPIAIRSEGDMIVKTGSWHGGTIGEAGNVQDRGFSYPNQIFTTQILGDNPGNAPRGRVPLIDNSVRTLFTVRSKDLYNGLPNKVKTDVINLTIDIEPVQASGTVQIQLVGNPAIGGSVFSDVSPSSVIEIDDNANGEATGTYTPGVSGGQLVGEPININYTGSGGFFGSAQGGEGQALVNELSLDGIAGETLTCIARDLGGNDVNIHWFITWVERQI